MVPQTGREGADIRQVGQMSNLPTAAEWWDRPDPVFRLDLGIPAAQPAATWCVGV